MIFTQKKLTIEKNRRQYSRNGYLLLFSSTIMGEKPWINPGRHQHWPEPPLSISCASNKALASWHRSQLSLKGWSGELAEGDAWVREILCSLRKEDGLSPVNDAFPRPDRSTLKWGCWRAGCVLPPPPASHSHPHCSSPSCFHMCLWSHVLNQAEGPIALNWLIKSQSILAEIISLHQVTGEPHKHDGQQGGWQGHRRKPWDEEGGRKGQLCSEEALVYAVLKLRKEWWRKTRLINPLCLCSDNIKRKLTLPTKKKKQNSKMSVIGNFTSHLHVHKSASV